jgi:hypothetical protein
MKQKEELSKGIFLYTVDNCIQMKEALLRIIKGLRDRVKVEQVQKPVDASIKVQSIPPFNPVDFEKKFKQGDNFNPLHFYKAAKLNEIDESLLNYCTRGKEEMVEFMNKA